jgi:hypothetical protein
MEFKFVDSMNLEYFTCWNVLRHCVKSFNFRLYPYLEIVFNTARDGRELLLQYVPPFCWTQGFDPKYYQLLPKVYHELHLQRAVLLRLPDDRYWDRKSLLEIQLCLIHPLLKTLLIVIRPVVKCICKRPSYRFCSHCLMEWKIVQLPKQCLHLSRTCPPVFWIRMESLLYSTKGKEHLLIFLWNVYSLFLNDEKLHFVCLKRHRPPKTLVYTTWHDHGSLFACWYPKFWPDLCVHPSNSVVFYMSGKQ